MCDEYVQERRRLRDTLERVTRCYLSKAPAPQKAPPPIPPVTQTNAEVQQASRQTRLDSARRKGFGSTILAGEQLAQPSQYGGKTLLGS